jgi:hypothetical protein
VGRLLLALLLLSACGPSLRMIERGDVYFERCYAAELEAALSVEDKRACWEAWLAHYVTGQPIDRQRYAASRVEALARGETLAPVEPTPPLPLRRSVITATDADGPPSAEPLPRTGNPLCAAEACEEAWRACRADCGDGDGCRTACEVELQTCAHGCF